MDRLLSRTLVTLGQGVGPYWRGGGQGTCSIICWWKFNFLSRATSWWWPWPEAGCAEVVDIVGGKSFRKTSWSRWMHSWRLLVDVCRLREEGKSVGGPDSWWIAFRPGGSHAKKRLFRRNSQLSLLTPHSVRIQPLSSRLSSAHNDLPYAQSMSKIFYHQ